MTRKFNVFFDLRPNKRLSKQSWGWWFETPPWSLWRQCNERQTSLGASALPRHHYIDVIMTTMASQITSLMAIYSTVYSDADKKNIKAPRYWPLCGEFTGAGEFPAQRASYTENFSIWWRHHDEPKPYWYDFNHHNKICLLCFGVCCYQLLPSICF